MGCHTARQAIEMLAREYGMVSCAHEGTDERLIVGLEDDPADARARRRVASVLSGLVNAGLIELVGIEGAFGEVDTSWLAQLPDGDLRHAMCDHMLDDLTLSPAEFCHVFAREPFVLLGLEDKDAYREAMRLWSELAPFTEYLDPHRLGWPTRESLQNAPEYLRESYPEVIEYARVLDRRVDEMLKTLMRAMSDTSAPVAAVIASGTPLDMLCEDAAERGLSYLRVKPASGMGDLAQYEKRLIEDTSADEYWEA
jgi:hypothetical protein